MLVLKFGGSCLIETADFRRAAAMVAERLREHSSLIVVISASLGATDALLEGRMEEQVERHRRMLDELGGRGPGLPGPAAVDPDGVEFAALGERLAQAVMAAALQEIGLDPELVEPGDLGLITDADPWCARPIESDDLRGRAGRFQPSRDGLVLVPGFYGNEAGTGRRRLLGRNSSDMSAVFFAVRSGAERVEMVSRARALMTADPLFLPEARPIPRASLRHLNEISFEGSPVVHRVAVIEMLESDIELVLHGLENGRGSLLRKDIEDDPDLVTLVQHEDLIVCSLPRRLDVDRTPLQQLGRLRRFRPRETWLRPGYTEKELLLIVDEEGAADLAEHHGLEVVREDGMGTIALVGPGIRSKEASEDLALELLVGAGIGSPRVMRSAIGGPPRLLLRNEDLRAAASILHEAFCR